MRTPGSPDTHSPAGTGAATEVVTEVGGPVVVGSRHPEAGSRLDALVRSLPPGRFRQALVPACGTGELAWRLAARCDHVTAFDESPVAIRRARRSSHRRPNVELLVARLPDRIPLGGPFDVLCLVDCGHRFDEEELAAVVDAMVVRSAREATLVASHWAGGIDLGHRLQGATVHDVIAARLDRHGFAPVAPLAVHGDHVTEMWSRQTATVGARRR